MTYHPDSPPPSIPVCPLCNNPLSYVEYFDQWVCLADGCPYSELTEADFSLAAYEADQQAKARYLDSLDAERTTDNFEELDIEDDSDDFDEDEW